MNEYIVEYRGYHVKPHKNIPTVFIVVTEGQGGKIPDMLNGMYTHRLLAFKDIDIYLDTKKEPKNGRKTNNAG